MEKEYKKKDKFDGIHMQGRCLTCGDEIVYIHSQNSIVYTYTCDHGGTIVIPKPAIQHTKMSKESAEKLDQLIGAINSEELYTEKEEVFKEKQDKEILKD